MRKNKRRLLIVIFLCIMILTLGMISSINPNITQGGMGLNLIAPPAHAQSSGNLANIAGMSAYIQTNGPIDLERVKSQLRGVEDSTDEYIIGLMIPPGYADLDTLDEIMDVHLMVHRDGWIIAYLLKEQESSIIIDWVGYEGNGLNETTLSNSINQIVNLQGLTIDGELSYYDFRYPSATSMSIVADSESDSNQPDSFDVNIPLNVVIIDSSYSVGSFDAGATASLNESQLISYEACRSCWIIKHANFNQNFFPPNSTNNLSITNQLYYGISGTSYLGIVLLYQE